MNPTMQKDVYKEYHVRAYHPEVSEVYSNFTNRSGKHSNTDIGGVVFAGLQYFIIDYLIEDWNYNFFFRPKDLAVKGHKRILSAMLGYDVDVTYLENLHDLGYLPLRIKALEEGTIVPYQVPSLSIVNTVEGFQWLPNMIETVLSTEIWPISTSATTATAYYKTISHAFEASGAPLGLLPFMGHDFSFRGMFGRQAAAMSGFGHLCSGFAGTDTIPAVLFAEQYYGADVDKELVGVSVDATEHSVTCSWIEEGEVEFIRYLMNEQTPSGVLSIVSDTWDFWKLVTEYLPELKDDIMTRDGTVVIRPDSGDPVDILCGTYREGIPEFKSEDMSEGWENEIYDYFADDIDDKSSEDCGQGYCCDDTAYRLFKIDGQLMEAIFDVEVVSAKQDRGDELYWVDEVRLKAINEAVLSPEQKGLVECLWDIFGGTTTEQGYKLLDSHIGAIYGDSITLERQQQIISRLMDKGFVPSVVLGIGSYTYQHVTRDTHGSAVKATNVVKDGRDLAIFKDPKTDTSKKSLKGLLRVEEEDGKLVVYDNQTREQEQLGLLTTVFEDGKLVRQTTLNDIRTKVKEQL